MRALLWFALVAIAIGTCFGQSSSTGGFSTAGSSSSTARTLSTSSSSSTTGPLPVLSGYWRGVQINAGYLPGEWNFTFTRGAVTITGPQRYYLEGLIYSSSSELDIQSTFGPSKGSFFYGIFQEHYGPYEVDRVIYWALSPLGSGYPPDWKTAISSPRYTVWILEQPTF